MRYTYINEKTKKTVYATDNAIDGLFFEWDNNLTFENLQDVILTDKYIITRYKNGYTQFLRKEY